MKKVYFILVGLISIATFHCQKELSYVNLARGQNPFLTTATTLQGNVLDENGQPAIGVVIKIGDKSAATDASGYFRIANASFDKSDCLITAEKAGYFKAYRSFIATTGVNQVIIRLVKKELSGYLSSTSGGDVTLLNGSKISLPANAIAKSSGESYAGTVNVYASYIDPSAREISQTIPGSFMAIDKSNKKVVLTSYGMLAVELESLTGEKLQIAPGNTATLTIPVPSSIASSAPSSISLWYINEQTGIWQEEGSAKKDGNNYVGEVKHFSFWNCDVGISAITLSMTLRTVTGSPMAYAQVQLRDADGSQSCGWTDSLGQVSGLVPSNKDLLMEVIAFPCYDAVYSKTIGSFSQNTDLGVVTIDKDPSIVTVHGKLMDCSNSGVVNGYAIIYFNNTVRYITVDNAGRFSADLAICPGTGSSFQILGVDNASQKQSIVTNFNIISPETNAGDISTCGSSSEQYINYTLDGLAHNISGNVTDSLFGVSEIVQANPPNYTSIWGIFAPDHIDFSYLHNNVAGIFPLTDLGVTPYGDSGIVFIQPFNITITNYPKNIGEFYEGSFSGQFTYYNTGATLHNINCDFRVRRQQ